MKKILLPLIILVSLMSFMTGEPEAMLTCQSESGRTVFKASLPSCSYLGTAAFSIDGSKYSFNSGDFSGIIFDPENKVFTIYLESENVDPKKHTFIQFWALPNSFKKVRSKKGDGSEFHDTYEFRAKIFGTEPRKGFEHNTKTIELICTLDYEL